MSEGEVVHCVCSHTEGDGMMVQCESCLTWQHGQCLGIDQEGQVGFCPHPQSQLCGCLMFSSLPNVSLSLADCFTTKH